MNELAFARDLESLYSSINRIEPNVVVAQTTGGDVAASVSVNEQDINRLVLDVARRSTPSPALTHSPTATADADPLSLRPQPAATTRPQTAAHRRSPPPAAAATRR